MSTTFDYFDQFPLIELDYNPYLESVKSMTGVDYKFTNIQPIKTTSANIFEKIELIIDFKKDILNFDPYTISENERIENVSYNKYSSVDYWWVIAIFNNIKNICTDWPLSNEQLIIIAEELYNTEAKYSKATYYDLLFERNEKKRNILLPKPLTINPITAKFRAAFEESNIG